MFLTVSDVIFLLILMIYITKITSSHYDKVIHDLPTTPWSHKHADPDVCRKIFPCGREKLFHLKNANGFDRMPSFRYTYISFRTFISRSSSRSRSFTTARGACAGTRPSCDQTLRNGSIRRPDSPARNVRGSRTEDNPMKGLVAPCRSDFRDPVCRT